VIGTITLTSIGLILGNNILDLAGNHLYLVAIFTMLISIVLGMGVPVTASYVITATLSAPLLAERGVPSIVAHMFAFFFAALSDITPPVALAAMAASGIAREPFLKVAFTAVRLGFIGFAIPYFFLYNPVLLFQGDSVTASIMAGISAMIGVIALSGAFSNWFITRTNIIQRMFLVISGVTLIIPGMISNLTGVLILVAIYVWQKIDFPKGGDASKTVGTA